MYKLVIKNDNFDALLINDNDKTKKKINCSIDTFDIDNKNFNISLNGLCNINSNDFNYIATYIYYFFGIPTHSIEYDNSNIKNTIKIKNTNLQDLSNNKNDNTIKYLNNQNVLNENLTITYLCSNKEDIAVACVYHFLKNGHSLNKCENCDKYFITSTKSNEKYCSRIYNNKTCKEIKKREKGKKLEDDKCFKLRKNVYNALRNKTDRARLKNDKDTLNRAIQKQNELLDNYPIWKDKLKNNQVSFKEYEDWIKSLYI